MKEINIGLASHKAVSYTHLGTCARHQRALTTAIKRARNIALMPYTVE